MPAVGAVCATGSGAGAAGTINAEGVGASAGVAALSDGSPSLPSSSELEKVASVDGPSPVSLSSRKRSNRASLHRVDGAAAPAGKRCTGGSWHRGRT